ncbi:arginine--tRNA ligase [Sulfidibacter corallicola]|uniref:Arginine--tRNA ligase n=1 Tax=Sulfidibacter corallicola TaxID=2818388 RepID=A0A8A4TWI7_SULCO|nr:arginine--tRNA ligase [Sulfidibacter corallicola]QTD54309.1 arginine--tRNA ligase [Sulfidibacter corallicola]
MSYQEQILALLKQVFVVHLGLDAKGFEDLRLGVEVPRDTSHGDFAVACFKMAKLLRKKPNLIATDILPHVQAGLGDFADLASVEALGPYLNFRVNKSAFAADVLGGIFDGSLLAPRPKKNLKMMIEYSQPNTHKAFHVGHMRNVALGDALIRICEWNGYDVVAVNYIGDEGTHIAKCLWYFRKHFDGAVPEENRGEFLGELYRRAVNLLDPKNLTRCPIPKVYAARVTAIEPSPTKKEWTMVTVDTGSSTHTVICGGTGFEVGDVVAYAGLGARIAGRQVGVLDKEGVRSEGMICSGKELGLSEEAQKIHVLPEETPLGTELAEVFRIEGALDPEVPVVDELQRRNGEVSDILKALEASSGEVHDQWVETKKWSMDEFHAIYDWLDVRFDHYFFESEVSLHGKEMVFDYLERGVLVRSEGAVGANLEEYKLPFLLLLKSDGTGLYATKDLSLAHVKFNDFGVDHSVYVVDASQSLHFQQVFATLDKMGFKRAKNCFHLPYGLVKLKSGKMGSRHGNVILFSELQTRLEEKFREDHLNRFIGEWSDEEIHEAARWISIATIKYGMLNTDNMNEIVFDMDDWTNKSGNTGSYMLYAYARTRSIMRKIGDVDESKADWSLLGNEYEVALLKSMARFPEVVARAGQEYKPNQICTYLFALSKEFSKFWEHCPVLQAETESLKMTRALLIEAVGRVLKKGLELIGLRPLERI